MLKLPGESRGEVIVSVVEGAHELRRLWTQELYREYENVLYQHRVRLRPAVLAVDELAGVWGRWDPTTRTIALNARLIELYSWDVVVEVLKHEVAHQLVHEWYGGDHTHGRFFKEACERLGVADWAATASGELPTEIPRWQDRALTPDEEKLLRRAEKLLALATSHNEHEAWLAMERVRELYERHNLERLRARRGATFVVAQLSRGKKRIDVVESLIASVLVEHFMVQVIFGDTFDAKSAERVRVLEVFGTDENVRMAEYVHAFLYRTAHELWADYRVSTGKGAAAKRSYLVGVLTGFRDKLRAQSERAAGDAQPGPDASAPLTAEQRKALITVARAELDAFVQKRYPRLTTRSSRRGLSDHGSYAAGRDAGQRINLQRPIEGTQRRGRLLTDGR